MRIAVFVSDPDLGEAIAAALAPLGTVSVRADHPEALEAGDWDVCLVERGFAGAAFGPRQGCGLVVLTAASRPPEPTRPGWDAGPVVLMRLPCTLAELREAVRKASSNAARAG